MRVVEWIRNHLVASMAIGGALVGAVVGLFLPIRAASPSEVAADTWAPPSRGDLVRFQLADLERVRAAGFWNDPGQRREGPQAGQWELVAIITRPRLQAVVRRSSGGDTTPYVVSPGGQLPDGATLVAANRDTVWYQKGGCKRARTLYVKATDTGEACAGDAPRPAVKPAAPDAPAARTPQ